MNLLAILAAPLVALYVFVAYKTAQALIVELRHDVPELGPLYTGFVAGLAGIAWPYFALQEARKRRRN